jgi:hypothetical protein
VLKNRATAFRNTISNPRHYPAAALALAAVAIGVAPVTASAATAPAKPAAATATTAAKTTTTAKTTAKTTTAKATTTTATPAAKTETKAANPFAGATMSQLEPTGTVGTQSSITLSATQQANAATIVQAAENLHLSPYAATIAVATSMQESKLQNLTVAVDHDSLGLFQQRPSTGWGTPSELENPTYAATAFLKSLPSDYQNMSLHTAAQDVQRSFDGYLYAQWEDQAAHIVSSIVNS